LYLGWVSEVRRRLPVGAEPGAGGTHFRLWAPRCRRVEALLEGSGRGFPLDAEPGGYFSGFAAGVGDAELYRFRLDGGASWPDPASRFQPEGPQGASCVVDPSAYRWSDAGWTGVGSGAQVLYELHVGTFTREGTWDGARARLPELADLGITAVALMPVADFAGRFGWGYDGVCLFAPTRLYGTPDAFRRFVDEAHRLKLGVTLDVVYNHLGPDGGDLRRFSSWYFSRRTEWGPAFDLDGEHSAPVRELLIANAAAWIGEYHLDGLRLDATQQVHDRSRPHVLAEIADAARAAAGARRILLVAESEARDPRLLKPRAEGGHGLDAVWNDDFHHAAIVALTGRRDGYFADCRGTPGELVAAARRGWLRRRQPCSSPQAFVNYLENHDQLANAAGGERLHRRTNSGRHRAMTAFLLLAPGTPLLFQGQEFSASSPFLFFADHSAERAAAVRRGRRKLLARFWSLAGTADALPDASDRASFERCVLDHDEKAEHPEAWALHRDLIRLRRGDRVLEAPPAIEGAALGDRAFLLRWRGPERDDRLLLVNLGGRLELPPLASEPLLSPPGERRWQQRWSSEAAGYGGSGARVEIEPAWRLPGEAAFLLGPA
jgi:maltooligosyltrehalose trehalohydrolase